MHFTTGWIYCTLILLLIDLSCLSRWSRIAANLPGRTDNEIKNCWNTRLKKKLLLSGLDPATHKPVDVNFDLSRVNPAPMQADPDQTEHPNRIQSSSTTTVHGNNNSVCDTEIPKLKKSSRDLSAPPGLVEAQEEPQVTIATHQSDMSASITLNPNPATIIPKAEESSTTNSVESFDHTSSNCNVAVKREEFFSGDKLDFDDHPEPDAARSPKVISKGPCSPTSVIYCDMDIAGADGDSELLAATCTGDLKHLLFSSSTDLHRLHDLDAAIFCNSWADVAGDDSSVSMIPPALTAGGSISSEADDLESISTLDTAFMLSEAPASSSYTSTHHQHHPETISIFTAVDHDGAYPSLMADSMGSCFPHSSAELPIPQWNDIQDFQSLSC